MATINLRIGKGTITSTLANIDTAAVPTATQQFVKAITLCNTHTSIVNVTITFAGTTVISEYPLPAKSGENTITIPFMDQIMEATERIQGLASVTNVVNFYISGKQVS